MGIEASHERVCVDRNRITGGGVTAGIDFGLTVIAQLRDQDTAEFVQLALEYDPQPPFNAGHPRTARPEIVAMISGEKGMMGEMTRRASRSRKRIVGAWPPDLTELPGCSGPRATRPSSGTRRVRPLSLLPYAVDPGFGAFEPVTDSGDLLPGPYASRKFYKIASNGIHINVEEQGRGDMALVFLHYWGGSVRTWKYVMPPLTSFYRTIANDHRGWGDSDAPADGYTLADHADDALGVVEALGIKRYVVIGHSMGGKVATFLASRRPEGLAGLVVMGAAFPAPLEFTLEVLEGVVHAYDTREAVEATLDNMILGKPIDPTDREQVVEDSLRGAPQAVQAWPRRTGQEDICDLVSAINVPTLAIYGDKDQVHSADSAKEEPIPRIPGGVLEVLPGTGHLYPLESPTDVVRLIDQFARELA